MFAAFRSCVQKAVADFVGDGETDNTTCFGSNSHFDALLKSTPRASRKFARTLAKPLWDVYPRRKWWDGSRGADNFYVSWPHSQAINSIK
jgi:hypothetical protein